ncbi:MAG: 1,4-alpha-glucan branching protein GlgB [Verrucomicrobiota bacterium]
MSSSKLLKTQASDPGQVQAVLDAAHEDPFAFLGMHERRGGDGCVVRTIQPNVEGLTVVEAGGDGREYLAERVPGTDFFEALIPDTRERFGYLFRLQFRGQEGPVERADAYSFGPILGDQDIYYAAEGTHRQLYRKFGAHAQTVDGVEGMTFSVWAPNARRVSVVGDFNHWDGRTHVMRRRIEAGIWEIFLPGVGFGAHYKFEIVGADGRLFLKSDPVAFFSQHGTSTASITYDLGAYEWGDEDWMETRRQGSRYREPVSAYEVHLGSWARIPEDGDRFLTYLEFADRLIPHVKALGFTHIELMPITEFPYDGSWGYQVTGYFAPTSRFGTPDEFRRFVDRCHQEGIGVILDWVPAHFPKDEHGLARFDGTPLYEHADPRQGEHKDWGTLIFNYGRNEVSNFLLASALFWLEQYHLDGLRVDAVASMLYLDYSREEGEWVPNQYGGRENIEAIQFLRYLNEVCYDRFPGIMMIAEESTAFAGVSRPTETGGLGFGFKWNMGWMHDFLEYFQNEPVHRKYHHGEATFSMIYAYDENFILPISHDEVVHGKGALLDKMPGDRWQKFANLRLFLAWMFTHPGKKLLFQGIEFGQSEEWDYQKSLDWHLTQYPEHEGVKRLLTDLNGLYRREKALYDADHRPEGFSWLDHSDADHSTFTFLRRDASGSSILLVAVNATPVPRERFRLGVPDAGRYQELLNTDSEYYAGSNMGSIGGIEAESMPWHHQAYSIEVVLPPMSTVIFGKADAN